MGRWWEIRRSRIGVMILSGMANNWNKKVRRMAVRILVAVGLATVGGCTDPSTVVGFDEADPGARIRAIQQASGQEDRQSLGKLIEALDSDDPAVRFLAVRALEKRTGQTFGYEHFASRSDREAAMKSWQDWFERTKS